MKKGGRRGERRGEVALPREPLPRPTTDCASLETRISASRYVFRFGNDRELKTYSHGNRGVLRFRTIDRSKPETCRTTLTKLEQKSKSILGVGRADKAVPPRPTAFFELFVLEHLGFWYEVSDSVTIDEFCGEPRSHSASLALSLSLSRSSQRPD